MDVGNLTSVSSAFSKTSLNIWKVTVHIFLKPGLENFEHYLISCETSAIVPQFEHFGGFPFFGIRMKTDLYSLMGTAEFSKFAGMLTAALSQHHH